MRCILLLLCFCLVLPMQLAGADSPLGEAVGPRASGSAASLQAATGPGATGQDEMAQAAPQYKQLAKQIVCDCPDCGKQTIDQCASGCERGRELATAVKAEIAAGKSDDQILEAMAGQYGEHILGVPRQQNFWGKMAPAMPFLILLLGLLPMTYIMRTRHRKAQRGGMAAGNSPKASRAASNTASDNDGRLDAALEKFDY
jgi:cytochrome c-type biogenesis protein CcmH/NrfF